VARPPKKPAVRTDQPATELRIIGGTLRGRKVHFSGLAHIRPMKDRVREAVFNLVGPDVKGKLAIDLFAGTGALGLEAISRGATTAIFVEQHFPSADLVRKNAQELGVAETCQVAAADVFHWARRHLPTSGPPWLVFCSPPYVLYRDRREDMLQLIATVLERAPSDSLIVVEADEQFDFASLPLAERWDVRHYPPAIVGLYRKTDVDRGPT